jgi:hypothetical protein
MFSLKRASVLCLGLLGGCASISPSAEESKASVRVFLLAGQSNMEGQAVVDLDHEEHYNGGRGTLVKVLETPEISAEFGHWGAPGAWTVREDVHVSYQPATGPLKAGPLTIGYAVYEGAHHFGPEMELGWELGEHFGEPVLLIKTCWGGKSLMKDFRPPSAGGDVGPFYRQMIAEYRDAIARLDERFPQLAGLQPELSGFFWFQGWNDMFTEGALPAYALNLELLVKDLRKDLDAPDLPFVVGQTGNADNNELWKAQEAATQSAEFEGAARYVPTRAFLRRPEDSPNQGHGHHWFGNAESYLRIGDAMGAAMVKLLSL